MKVAYKGKEYIIYSINDSKLDSLLAFNKSSQERLSELRQHDSFAEVLRTEDNQYYWKEQESSFFESPYVYFEIENSKQKVINMAQKDTVICKCGCNEFTLSYGDYSLDAKCIRCGLSDEVYSG